MFGVTPFAAYGVAEFSEATSGLRIDGGLVDEASRAAHPLPGAGRPGRRRRAGLCPGADPCRGPADARPAGSAPAAPAPPRTAADVADLRRRLAEAEGKAEGVLRVSRAQAEEIEELRARLRRASESRAELDQEVERLRKGAGRGRRVGAGSDPADPGGDGGAGAADHRRAAARARRRCGRRRPHARLREEIRRREEELAARESALSERDERIAGLEADKQDSAVAGSDAAEQRRGRRRLVARRPRPQRRARRRPLRPATLALEYRQAAAAHLQEVNRLREALAEQSTLVSRAGGLAVWPADAELADRWRPSCRACGEHAGGGRAGRPRPPLAAGRGGGDVAAAATAGGAGRQPGGRTGQRQRRGRGAGLASRPTRCWPARSRRWSAACARPTRPGRSSSNGMATRSSGWPRMERALAEHG